MTRSKFRSKFSTIGIPWSVVCSQKSLHAFLNSLSSTDREMSFTLWKEIKDQRLDVRDSSLHQASLCTFIVLDCKCVKKIWLKQHLVIFSHHFQGQHKVYYRRERLCKQLLIQETIGKCDTFFRRICRFQISNFFQVSKAAWLAYYCSITILCTKIPAMGYGNTTSGIR